VPCKFIFKLIKRYIFFNCELSDHHYCVIFSCVYLRVNLLSFFDSPLFAVVYGGEMKSLIFIVLKVIVILSLVNIFEVIDPTMIVI